MMTIAAADEYISQHTIAQQPLADAQCNCQHWEMSTREMRQYKHIMRRVL